MPSSHDEGRREAGLTRRRRGAWWRCRTSTVRPLRRNSTVYVGAVDGVRRERCRRRPGGEVEVEALLVAPVAGSSPAASSSIAHRRHVGRRAAGEDLALGEVGRDSRQQSAGVSRPRGPVQGSSARVVLADDDDADAGRASAAMRSSSSRKMMSAGVRALVHERRRRPARGRRTDVRSHRHQRGDAAAGGEEEVLRGRVRAAVLNRPRGPATASVSPGRRWSCSQFDTGPPGTRFTVIVSCVGPAGRGRDRVAAARTGSPVDRRRSAVRYWPGSNRNAAGSAGRSTKLRTSCVTCVRPPTQTRVSSRSSRH